MRVFPTLIIAFIVALAVPSGATAQSSDIEPEIRELAKTTQFRQAINRSFKVVDAIRGGLRRMQPAERAKLIAGLRAFSKKRGSAGSAEGRALIQQVSHVSGVGVGDIVDLGKLGQDLLNRYPILGKGPAAGGGAAYFFRSEYELLPIEEPRERTPEEEEELQCIRDCDEEYRVAYNNAGFSAFFDVIREFPTGGLFGWFIELPIELHELAEARVECIKLCKDWPPGFDCQNDSDCEADQYCHKPIGNPVNSCYPKKQNGEMCTRHAKCLSGCCKYHVWTNPVHPVCRPADKCN